MRRRDTGAWTRANIARDRAHFEAAHAEPFAGDPFPVGKTPEEIGSERLAGDWDAFEPNTWGGS